MLDHSFEFTRVDGGTEIDRVPVPLVHVVTGTDGGMTVAKLQRQRRIALEVHRTGIAVQPDESEDAAAHLEHDNAFPERIVLDRTRHAGAHGDHVVSGHAKNCYAKGDIVPIKDLAPFVGRWELAVDLPGAEDVRGDVTFELMGELLIQRVVIPVPEAPDSYCVILAGESQFVQHYFDSRGVARRYEMTFDGRTWTLERTKPDLTPLEFCQRFTGTLSDDGDVISGEWQASADGNEWTRDFTLTYRRIG